MPITSTEPQVASIPPLFSLLVTTDCASKVQSIIVNQDWPVGFDSTEQSNFRDRQNFRDKDKISQVQILEPYWYIEDAASRYF